MTDAPDPIAQPDEWSALESAMRDALMDKVDGVPTAWGLDWNDEFVVTPILERIKPVILAALREARLKLEAANEMTQFCHDHHDTDLAVQRLVTERDALLAGIASLRREHLVCDDCWYTCPLATDEHGESECCNDRTTPACNCGASAHNAKIDALLSGESHP